MRFKRTDFEKIGETLLSATLKNGLPIFVVPKKGFGKAFALYATNFGAVDSHFLSEGGWTKTPDGIAHFLEHKMFEQQDGNALMKFSKTGASVNAFTSYVMTAYHFEATDLFYENLDILLHFVNNPYFTDENVKKERGIIAQEIRMMEDSPEWCSYVGIFKALYKNHTIRSSIAGTVDSIQEIDADTLYRCHRAFYSPSNMVLCVAGDVDPDRVCEAALRLTPEKSLQIASRDYGEKDEPPQAHQGEITRHMQVSMPLFMGGFKDALPEGGFDRLYRMHLAEIALEYLCGKSSPLYNRLYGEGLINHSFECSYFPFPGGAALLFGGESRDPKAVMAEILKSARDVLGSKDRKRFDEIKNAAYGARLRALDLPEAICINQATAYFSGGCALDFARYNDISLEEAEYFIEETARPERYAISQVLPEKEQSK